MRHSFLLAIGALLLGSCQDWGRKVSIEKQAEPLMLSSAWFGPSLSARAEAGGRSVMIAQDGRDLLRLQEASSPWATLAAESDHDEESILLFGRSTQPPYTLHRSMSFEAEGRELLLRATLKNTGPEPLPVAAGLLLRPLDATMQIEQGPDGWRLSLRTEQGKPLEFLLQGDYIPVRDSSDWYLVCPRETIARDARLSLRLQLIWLGR